MVLEEIDDAARHLKGWMKPKRAFAGITNFPSRGRVYYEPFGTVLIISPWNYPFMLALSPLVGAVAAGNCAVLKPSSQTPQTGEIIRKIVNEALEPRHVYVAGGGHEVSDRLLELPFDFIFFTGSPSVGKRVMRKAAEHLIPVVLELGGKSPCIVDATADLKAAARRIVWGKFVNAGQTCVAPITCWWRGRLWNHCSPRWKDMSVLSIMRMAGCRRISPLSSARGILSVFPPCCRTVCSVSEEIQIPPPGVSVRPS